MADNITEKRMATLVAQRDKIVVEIETLKSMVKTEQLKVIAAAKDRDMWKSRTELFMTVSERLCRLVLTSVPELKENDNELIETAKQLIEELRRG